MKIKESDLKKYYDELVQYHENHLKEYGVRLPHLYWGGELTKGALVLIYLYKNFQKPVSKDELTDFLGQYGDRPNDVQQARHLGQQDGWYIISGKRHDIECKEFNVKRGEYSLIKMEEFYPRFDKEKRKIYLTDDEWESIKKKYDYRCATCGSKEGEPNIHYPSIKTQLQKGHMDPDKPLEYTNIIPQCDSCNRPDRNYFVYNDKGRVIKISNPYFVLKSKKDVQKEMLRILTEELTEE